MSSELSPLAPPRFPQAFYKEAGRACAHYLRNGGRLREIRMEDSLLLQHPLQLTPPPQGGKTTWPVRKELEEDLRRLWDQWHRERGTPLSLTLRFLYALCREMEKFAPGWLPWARCWLRDNQREYIHSMQAAYRDRLSDPCKKDADIIAHWEPCPTLDPKGLKILIEEQMRERTQSLSLSLRAVVLQADFMGEQVIIKRYAPNPKLWKRRWEHSRARRAWAASEALREAGLPAIQGLGWLECYERGKLQESYFISRQLTEMETLRVWLRREYPRLSEKERARFRHRLRSEILNLKNHGLVHVDLKLSNILVKGNALEDLVFYWIDLEDLRVAPLSRRVFVRNLYQLNGSLPRFIPKAERMKFASGFRGLFFFADSPRLMNYVQRKTRKRHLDQLKRIQGA